MIRKLWSWALAAALSVSAFTVQAVVQVDIEHDTEGVRLGYWTSDFAAAKALADKDHIPMVGFWGSAGCGYCALMKSSGLLSDEFLAWVKTHKIVMCYVEVPETQTGVMTPAKEFMKGSNKSGLYPFMTFYWNKADGSTVKVDFSGRKGSIPPKTKGTTGAQFVAGLNHYFGSYKPAPVVPDYTGGYFAVTNDTADARLEALVGQKSVNVPLTRTATAVGTNKIQVASGALAEVKWAANVTNQVVACALPDGQAAGSKVALKLYAADGKTVKSTAYVNIVNEPAVSVTNPKWIGESFSAGEWTMDLDAALAKAKNSSGARFHTIVFASGALWCPWCISVESKVLDSAKFITWAKQNNVNLVLLDNPKRSAADVKDADGNVTSVGTKNDGAPPSLLRYAVGSNGKSGAAYMTRKNIAVGSPTTKGTAEYVLQRNHDLLYKGGKLAAPEVMRTGYPTFLLVNPDGTVAAKLLSGSDTANRVWGLSVDETVDRFSELLSLEGGDMKNSAPSTTTETLAVEDWGDGDGQVNANTMFFKLANVPAGKVTFEASGYDAVQHTIKPTLTVYETSSTLAKATKLGSAEGKLTVTFATGANKYLAVSHYTDNLAAYGVRTDYSFDVSSTVTLVPAQASNSFTTKSGKVNVTVTAGAKYKLDGFNSYTGFTKNADGTYTASKSGTLAMTANKGAKVTFQLWTPGTIQFAATSAAKKESDGSGTVSVTRTGGASGAARATVTVGKGSLNTGRVTVTPATLSWADGDASAKTVTYKIAKTATADPTETFAITLAAASGSAATLGANKTFTLTLTDMDDPVFANTKYTLRAFKGFDATTSFPVSNILENKNVTFARTGTIPTGMKLAYDAASKSMVLSGSPKRLGTFTFTIAMTEKRTSKTATGAASTFEVTVVDAKKLKPGEAGYNPLVAAGKTVYGSIPVYGKIGGKTALAGVATLKAYRSGRATLAYKGTDGARGTYSGALALASSGTASLKYSRGGVTATLQVDAAGKAKLGIEGLSTRFGKSLQSESAGYSLFNGSPSAYAGYYTVTLPANEADLTAGAETIPTGTGYVILKMNTAAFARTGKVSYQGMLASGQTFSGSAYLSGAMATSGGAQWAYLPVSVSKGAAGLGAVLRIKRNAAATHAEDPQVVLAATSSVPVMLYDSDFTSLNVYGGIYDKTLDFSKCCEDYYETTTFKFVSATKYFASSALYGAIKTVPDSTVAVNANDKLVVTNLDAVHPVTLSLAKSTGVVTGRLYVTFAGGKRMLLKIRGVVLVGWADCGCSDDAGAVIERPIFSGAAFYADRIGGGSAKRGFAVELRP